MPGLTTALALQVGVPLAGDLLSAVGAGMSEDKKLKLQKKQMELDEAERNRRFELDEKEKGRRMGLDRYTIQRQLGMQGIDKLAGMREAAYGNFRGRQFKKDLMSVMGG